MTIAAFLRENNSKTKHTKKLHVRDLDQINDFETVAYIDDADESYDVKIIINSRKNIVDTVCDCQEVGVCKHIVALVMYISENKTINALKKPIRKKQTETDELLNSLDNDTLRIWISEILNTNKELAFIFKNQFGIKQVVFNSDFVKETVKESLQSVIGKRRKIETAEVKKFVDALTLSTKELLEHVYFAPITNGKYILIKTLIDELETIHQNYYVSSIKITRFIETILDTLIKTLFNIKNIDVWHESVVFYFSQIFKDGINLFELLQCEKIYEFSKINANRQQNVVQIIEENINLIYQKTDLSYINLGFEKENFVFKVYTENNLFEKNASKFKPKLYQNEYNINLLDALMKIERYDSVEGYCKEIIERNYQEKYNIPYLKYLIEIYKNKKEDQKLAKLYSVYGKYIYDINVYLFIKENLALEDFKKYRLSVFSYARNSYQNGDIEAFDFYFEIKKLEEKEYDLFEMLINSKNLSFLNIYKKIAFNISEKKFVETLFRFDYNYYDDIEEIKNLAHYIVENVEIEKLKIYLKQNSYKGYTQFYKILNENIN